MSRRAVAGWLVGLVALAAALRLLGLASGLWLDEIGAVTDARDTPWLELFTTFRLAGRHLLYSVLVKALLGLFGFSEVVVRLPALIAGVAGVPAIYLLARRFVTAGPALGCAATLAVSYHHVFFSTNARGYTLFLLGATLGTAFFLRGLERDDARDWILAAVGTMVAAWTMVLAVFVAAGQVVALLVAVVQARARRRPPPPWRHAVAAWCGVGVGVAAVYAPVLLQMPDYARRTYTAPTLGKSLLSRDSLEVLTRGLGEGFGRSGSLGLVAALLILLLAGVGWLAVTRRHPVASVALSAPLLLQGLFHLASGLRMSPRFFAWALPVVLVYLVAGASLAACRLASRPRVAAALVPTVVASFLLLSVVSLPRLAREEKQPYRAALEAVIAQRTPREPVVGLHLMRGGLRFYGPRLGLEEGVTFFVVSPGEDLEGRLSSLAAPWVLTTMEDALAVEAPDVWRALHDRYHAVMRFPALVRGAEVRVWRPRPATAERVP